MLLQVCRLSLLFARLASWHVNCRKRYFLLSRGPLRGPLLTTLPPSHIPLTMNHPQLQQVWACLCLCVSLSGLLVSSWAWAWVVLAAGCGFSLAAVAYFNPPRWWRAYIIHNYRFHFCLPVIIVAFLDVFFFFFFSPANAVFIALLRRGCCCCCRCCWRFWVAASVSYGFLIFNFYDVLMDIFLTWPPGAPLLWP